MAVTEVIKQYGGRQASAEFPGKATYTMRYIVKTDDVNDGIDAIMDSDDIPEPGDEWEIGNDDDGSSVAKKFSIEELEQNLWQVTVTFGARDTESQSDNPSGDWRLEGPEIDVSTTSVSRPAEYGTYCGQFLVQGGGNAMPIIMGPDKGQVAQFDARGPITQDFAKPGGNFIAGGISNAIPKTNSAWTPFDPPPEAEYSRLSIRITRNHAVYPTALMGAFQDTVNAAPFFININGFQLMVPPFVARLVGVSGSRQFAEESPYWRVSYELLLDFYTTWRVLLLDRGFQEAKEEEDAQALRDSDDNGDPIPLGMNKEKHNIIDDKGLPLTAPVLMDGHGKVMMGGSSPIYLWYAIYQERDFSQLQFHNPGPILVMPN